MKFVSSIRSRGDLDLWCIGVKTPENICENVFIFFYLSILPNVLPSPFLQRSFILIL